MQEYQQFEDHIQKKFDAITHTTDDDKIWANVKADLDQEKKKKRVIAFWLLGSLASICIISFFFLNKGAANVAATESIIKSEKIAQDSKIHSNANTIKDKLETENDIFKNQINLENQASTSEASTLAASTNTKPNTHSRQAQSATQAAQNIFNKPSAIETKSLPSQNPILNINQNPIVQKSTVQTSTVQTPNTAQKKNKPSDKILKPTEKIIFNTVLITNPNGLPQKTNYVEGQNRGIPLLDTPISQIPQVVEKVVENNSPWVLSLSTGVQKPFVSYTQANGTAENLAFKDEIQRPLEALSTDLDIGYKINKRWMLKCGIRYMELHNASSYNFEESSLEIEEDWSYTSASAVHVTTETTTNTNTQVERYSAIRSLSFQTKASFLMIEKNQFSMGLGMGIDIPFWSQQTGIVHDDYKIDYDTKEDVSERYKMGLSPMVLSELAFGYKLNSNWQLSLTVDYRYSLNNITTTHALVHERYNFLGLKFGTLIHF